MHQLPGEHGIISPKDPRSPVSTTRVAEATCAPAMNRPTSMKNTVFPPAGCKPGWIPIMASRARPGI